MPDPKINSSRNSEEKGVMPWESLFRRTFPMQSTIALGVLNILCNNIVGANGIGVEPQPRRSDGSISNELSRDLPNLS